MPRGGRPDPVVLSRLVQATRTTGATQDSRPAKFHGYATASSVVRQKRSGLSRDVNNELPPFPASSSDTVTETFVNTVYEDDEAEEEEEDGSVGSNDDARDIEYQPTRKLDIAVGTGTCVLKHDRRDARQQAEIRAKAAGKMTLRS